MRIILLILLASCSGSFLSAQSNSQDAWELFRNRQYASALARFEVKEANLYPEWEVVHDAMGWCHYFLEDFDAAEKKFERALEIKSDYKWSLEGLQVLQDMRAAPLESAEAMLSAGRYAEARAAFQRIQEGLTEASRSQYPQAKAGEAWCLYCLSRYKEAKSKFRDAMKKMRGDADCYFGIGYCDYALADYRNAVASLELGLRAQPGNYQAQLTIGWSYYWREDYSKAARAFDSASLLEASDWQAWSGRAWSRYRLDDKAEALREFKIAIAKSPYAFNADLRALAEADANWRSLIRLAAWSALRYQLNTWAESEFEAAIALNPNDWDAHAGLAFSHFRLGAYEQAIGQIHSLNGKADSLGPWEFPIELADGSQGSVQMNLQSLTSWCHLRLGAYGDALAGFRAVRRTNPSWVDAASGEAWTLYTQGDYAAAETVFAVAGKLQAGYPDAISGSAAVQTWRFFEYNEAWSMLLAGAAEEAQSAFMSLLEQSGYRFPKERNDLLQASLGWAMLAQKDFSNAGKRFELALQLAPDSSLAHRGWGRLAMDQQDWKIAAKHLQLALKDPAALAMAEIHAELGWSYLHLRKWQDSDVAFEQALELDQNCATALAGMGTWSLGREDPVEGRLTWERAIALDPATAKRWGLHERMTEQPELVKLHSSLGWAWYYRSDFVQAEAEFRLARQKDPFELSVLRGLGQLLLQTGEVEEGLNFLEAYLEELPKHESSWGPWSSTLSSMGWALYQEQRYRDALAAFRKLEELHRGEEIQYVDAFDGAGWCLLRLGKIGSARKEFLKAIGISPRYESSLLGLEALSEEL